MYENDYVQKCMKMNERLCTKMYENECMKMNT